jgi:hypothetical protein
MDMYNEDADNEIEAFRIGNNGKETTKQKHIDEAGSYSYIWSPWHSINTVQMRCRYITCVT